MKIELVVEGKGAFSVETEVEHPLKRVEKVLKYGHDLLNREAAKTSYGFASTGFDRTERSEASTPAEVPFVDREAWEIEGL